LELRQGVNPGQSWVRAGGEALEIFFSEYYNPLLNQFEIRIRPLIGRSASRNVLQEMGSGDEVGDAKLDMALERRKCGRWNLFGGAHVKASLVQRVSDDVPASRSMMQRGYPSPLLTLDVKSMTGPQYRRLMNHLPNRSSSVGSVVPDLATLFLFVLLLEGLQK